MTHIVLELADADRATIRAVHPPDWTNPDPAPFYDLVVVGGGTAGLVSAIGAAGLGARVALVERHRLGGDCLNVGCVPSKALLRSARVCGDVRHARAFGVHTGSAHVDFAAVMARMRERRAQIAVHDSADRLRAAGADLFFGDGRFVDSRHVDVDGRRLRFGRAVIATGSRPTAPPVPGLDTVPYLTNETLFALTELPRQLVVIGAGATGCEMAQAFARFGSAVTMFDQAPRVLPAEDPDASAIVARRLAADGVTLHLGVRLGRVEAAGGRLRIEYEDAGRHAEAFGDRMLVAAGRAPNIERLGLDAAGIGVSKEGVVVDDRLRTSNRRIYAAGDVCSRFKFTHAADAMARIVIQNALFFGRRRVSALVIPWCTYTDPEVAHVGISPADTSGPARRSDIGTITIPMGDIDRAVVDDQTEGFVRVHHSGGRLVGCTVVAAHAGDIIGEAAYAMTTGGSLGDLSVTIHPYPTQAEALRKAGDAYRRSSLSPGVRRWLERVLSVDAPMTRRQAFALAHPDVFVLDGSDPAALEAYLHAQHVLEPSERIQQVSAAGAGNMNCTLRVVSGTRAVIVKQGRPWVEKYEHIDAPWGRTLVEAAFYDAVSHVRAVAARMPARVHLDAVSQILVVEDVGSADLTPLYAGATLSRPVLEALLAYLLELHAMDLDAATVASFANRAMRALNHEHIFRFPLLAGNDLDLDAVTPGLQALADELKRDATFVGHVEHLGQRYAANGRQLVHGDFFPGSWLACGGDVRVIDPEFCFCGCGEFDFGVLLAHVIISNQPSSHVDVVRDVIRSRYDVTLVNGFAGAEIMRRLIGVAQLPHVALLERKRVLLEHARRLVLT